MNPAPKRAHRDLGPLAVRKESFLGSNALHVCFALPAWYFSREEGADESRSKGGPGIRLDEDAVLKTAGANALRGSSPWSSALNETNSPVAQRRRHLVYTQSIDGSSPSRTTQIGFRL